MVDLSIDGLAFEASADLDINITNLITLSIHDTYLNNIKETKQFTENVRAFVRDISLIGNEKRYGCYIENRAYREYMQDLYTAYACS
ncbi:MAG: hypothetical protein IJS12_07285 [Lachnospiraceae bacterium]|nr:hypothetical protein [Lachnospiraceae bacterium]